MCARAQRLGEDVSELSRRLNVFGSVEAASNAIAELVSMPEDVFGEFEVSRVAGEVEGGLAVEVHGRGGHRSETGVLKEVDEPHASWRVSRAHPHMHMGYQHRAGVTCPPLSLTIG